jgi:hypothetical protein
MKKKRGRPEIKIDWDKVDSYLKAQCNGSGIAGLLGISPDTLYDKCLEDKKSLFSVYSAQKKSEGQELLRAKQHLTAMEGNVTMQIWLGKQYLGQKDRSDITSDNESLKDLNVIVDKSETAETLKKLRDGGKVN